VSVALARMFGLKPAKKVPIDDYVPVLSRAFAALADFLVAESMLPDLDEAYRGAVAEDEVVARFTAAQQAAMRLHEAAHPLTTVQPGLKHWEVHQAALLTFDAQVRLFAALVQMMETSDAITTDDGKSYRRAREEFWAADQKLSKRWPRLQSELLRLHKRDPELYTRLNVPESILSHL
jgi:hypothetical protein